MKINLIIIKLLLEKPIKKVFKWNKYEVAKAISGVFLFCLALNLFIVPNNLYNGGVLGISQLVSNLVNSIFKFKINIVGMVNFLINLPLFIKILNSFAFINNF